MTCPPASACRATLARTREHDLRRQAMDDAVDHLIIEPLKGLASEGQTRRVEMHYIGG